MFLVCQPAPPAESTSFLRRASFRGNLMPVTSEAVIPSVAITTFTRGSCTVLSSPVSMLLTESNALKAPKILPTGPSFILPTDSAAAVVTAVATVTKSVVTPPQSLPVYGEANEPDVDVSFLSLIAISSNLSFRLITPDQQAKPSINFQKNCCHSSVPCDSADYGF